MDGPTNLPIPPGIDGFLGTRASLMLDLVVVAMGLVLPVIGWSIYQVRYRRQYSLHKWVQLILGAVLLLTVAAFELDMRLHGWRERARLSPYYREEGWSGVSISLMVHLFFAVTTVVLWLYVTIAALRRFANPPAPGAHSRGHIFWARLAAWDMAATAVTGWIFYWLAFVA
jgi:putative membrane protein